MRLLAVRGEAVRLWRHTRAGDVACHVISCARTCTAALADLEPGKVDMRYNAVARAVHVDDHLVRGRPAARQMWRQQRLCGSTFTTHTHTGSSRRHGLACKRWKQLWLLAGPDAMHCNAVELKVHTQKLPLR